MTGGGVVVRGQVKTLFRLPFRLPLLPFCSTHLSVSCLAGIDLLVDDLRIYVFFWVGYVICMIWCRTGEDKYLERPKPPWKSP